MHVLKKPRYRNIFTVKNALQVVTSHFGQHANTSMSGYDQVPAPYVSADSSLYTVTDSKVMTPHMTSFDEQPDSVKLPPPYSKADIAGF